MSKLSRFSAGQNAVIGLALIVGVIAVGLLIAYKYFQYQELDKRIVQIRESYDRVCGQLNSQEWLDNVKQATQEGNAAAIEAYPKLLQANVRHEACIKSRDATIARVTDNMSDYLSEGYPREVVPVLVNRKTHLPCGAGGCDYASGMGAHPETVAPGEPGYPKDLLPEPLPLNKYTLQKCRKFGCGDNDRLVYGDADYPKVWWRNDESSRDLERLMGYRK